MTNSSRSRREGGGAEEGGAGHATAQMMAVMLEVRLLGTPEVRSNGAPIVLASARAQSVLAYLVLQRGRPQRRDQLAFLLWPNSTEKQARTNLRHVLHTLRTTIPDADRYLDVTPQTLGWQGAWADVVAFEAALDRAADAADAADADRVKWLREAIDSYGGELLRGWYDDWVMPERDRLRRRMLAGLAQIVQLLEARGNRDLAITYAERSLAVDPLAEATYQTLMRLHDARGDRARALRVYHECATTLRDELGVEPSAATRAAYEALLPREPAGSPAPNAPQRGSASFLGRPAERRRLTELWQESRQGRAQLVVVSGEPGVGKTRLLDELRLWAAHRGAVTATGRSYPVEGALAYAPVVAWLREPAIARWRGRLDRRRLEALARLLPELPVQPAPEEPESRAQLFEAAARALLAGPGPVLLIADDLHAADRQTVQFLHYLLRAEPDAPLLVAATARLAETDNDDSLRELLSGLRTLDRCTQLELERFDRAETGALAERFAGRRLDDAQVDRLYAETAGNPLFILETLRSGWPGRSDSGTLTPKMHAVLEARLGQLTAGARVLLGVAATVGSSIDVDLLDRLRAGDEDGLTRDLDELWRRKLLLATEADRYDFSHDKLREVAYRSLSPAQRRRNHRLVATALQEAYAERLNTVAGRIAAHLVEAGARTEAVDWYARAATAAQRVYADADAAQLLARALHVLRSAPESSERHERELYLLTAMLGPLAAAEGYGSPRLAAAVDEALDLTRRLNLEPAATLLRARGMAVLSVGQVDAALEIGAELSARGATDDVLAVEGEFVQGMAAYWQGDLTRAGRHLQAALARYRPENRSAHVRSFAQDPQVLCLARLAHVHLFLGDPAEARRLQRESLDLARAIGHPFTLGAALLFAGLLDVELQDLAALRKRVAELDALREHGQAPPIRLGAEALAGYLDVVGGRAAAGLARVDAALADSGLRTAPGLPAMLLRIRLAACEQSGDTDQAVTTAKRLLADEVRVWDGRARAVLHGER